MVLSIRNIEKAMGDGVKIPSESEAANKDIIRKSIVAKNDIKIGDIFSVDNITTKRPGDGISPMYWYEVLGKRANRNFNKDEKITL